MLPNRILTKICSFRCNLGLINNRSYSTIDIEKLEKETSTGLDAIDEEAKQRENEIQRKRNKSRLNLQHYNMVHDKMPYKEPKYFSHGTLKYARRMYGLFGDASGVNPSLCWPVKQELEDKVEYERIAFPFTIPDMVETAKRNRQEKEHKAELRQKHIGEKLKKLDGWIEDLNKRLVKKEAEAQAVKDRKERLVEEVRRHFGYSVDPRDEKFKEMLEKKEKEQKKVMKEARKKAKEEKMLTHLMIKDGPGKRKKEEQTNQEK